MGKKVRQSQASNPSDKHRFGFRKKADMDITAGSGGVSAEDEDGGRQDGWLGTTLGMEAGFVAGDLGSEIGFGRGSSGGSSADPNETLAAADKEPPSSNEASSAGDAKKNKRIRFDRARGGHLTLLLDVTTGSGGGGGCERIVKLRPGGTSEPYVGNKPLASMVISGEVSVSDSAISGQAAANLKASISVLQQLCSWKKSDLQKFIDGACGALKYKVDKINAHANLLSLSPSLLFLCVTSDVLNASVIYEDSSADGAFKSLVLSEFGEDRASSHIFVSVASSDTGESSAFESLTNRSSVTLACKQHTSRNWLRPQHPFARSMELSFRSSARTQVHPQRGFRPLESGPIRNRRALFNDTFLWGMLHSGHLKLRQL